MALIALLVGMVLVVSTIRNTHGELLEAIREDAPAFVIWGAALLGVAVIGFIPGLRPVSRALLALVIVVLILTNYRQIIGGFQGVAFGAVAQSKPEGDDTAEGDATLSVLSSLLGSGRTADFSPYVQRSV